MLATPLSAKSPQDQMFPGGVGCYGRSYTDKHLAAHPAQRVTEISISPVPDDTEPLLGLFKALKGLRRGGHPRRKRSGSVRQKRMPTLALTVVASKSVPLASKLSKLCSSTSPPTVQRSFTA